MGNDRVPSFAVVMRVIELVEYVPKTLPRDELTLEVAEKECRPAVPGPLRGRSGEGACRDDARYRAVFGVRSGLCR